MQLYFSLYKILQARFISSFFVQLLSLHGKAEVLVERLQLTVIEDHGGTGLSRYSGTQFVLIGVKSVLFCIVHVLWLCGI